MTTQRVQPQGPADGQRLEEVLQGIVRQQGDREHDERDGETRGAEGDQHGERPAMHAPKNGM